MSWSARAFFFLICILTSVPTFANEKYPFLSAIPFRTLSEGERNIYLIGELHRKRTDGKEQKPEAVLYSKVKDEIYAALNDQPFLFLVETAARDDEDEAHLFEVQNRNLANAKGACHGIENAHAKVYAMTSLLHGASKLFTSAIQKGKDATLLEKAILLTGPIQGSLEIIFEVLPALLLKTQVAPLDRYWQVLEKHPVLSKDAAFTALNKVALKFMQRAKDQETAYAQFEQDFFTDPEQLLKTALMLSLTSTELARAMLTDAAIPKEQRLTYPLEVFNGAVTDEADLLGFIKKNSKVRERYMVENILAMLKTYPTHDVIIQVGRDHLEPLRDALRTAFAN